MAPLSSDRLALLRATLAGKGLAAPRAEALPRRAGRATAPLSAAQERLFFLELLDPGTALYNDAVLVWIEGELEPERVGRALAAVAARHEILRTTFELGAEGPLQRIHEGMAPPLLRIDLSAEAAPREAARVRAVEEARTPFDLEAASPWRVALVRLGPREWALLVTMHHILSDGASMGLLFDELARHYAADSGPDLAPPLAIQFGDYTAWERSSGDPARDERDLAWWAGALRGGLPRCAWPDAQGSASGRGLQVPLRFESDVLERLASLARSARATANQLLLAAWFAWLGSRTEAAAACTGIASSLRTRRELEPLIGFFVQSLPLRLDLGGDPDFLELVERVRRAGLEAQAHGGLAFDRILRAAAQPSSSASTGSAPPPPQTFFSHMRDAIRAPAFPGTEARWEFVDPGLARFELALVLHESATELTGFLEVDLGLFPPATARRLAEDFTRLVGLLLADPTRRLSTLRASPPPTPRRAPPAFPGSLRLRRAAGE